MLIRSIPSSARAGRGHAPVRAASILIIGVLPLLAPACGRRESTPRGQPLGYRLAADSVQFQFESAPYTNRDAWQRSDALRTVAVAGPFNGWSTSSWPMQEAENAWTLTTPLAMLASADTIRFKFVVNGSIWAEPPRSASNRVPCGGGWPDCFNLFFVLPGSRAGS